MTAPTIPPTPARPPLRTTFLRRLPYALAGLAWVALCYIVLAGQGAPGASCAAAVYRDPVTGRMTGMGRVYVLEDGRIACPRG